MKKLKLTGQLKSYLEWPLALIFLWAVLVVLLFIRFGRNAGLTALIFLAVYALAALVMYLRHAPRVMKDLISFATEYGQVQKKMLQEFPIPYALLDENGYFLWMNDEFLALTGRDRHYHRKISMLFPEIDDDQIPGSEERKSLSVVRGENSYRVELQKVYVEELISDENDFEIEDTEYLVAVSLFEETELLKLKAEREDNKPVCGFLCIDNYDEALEGVEDVRKSLLLALVERKINKYFSEVDGIVRKQSHDRYFFQMRKKSLEECEEARFPLLDDVKTVNIGNELSLTISIGIGLGTLSYLSNAEEANSALDLALGRGGDQVVVKDGYRTRFFGGKTEQAEKSTRVKARVKAHALKEIIDGKARVVVMGHKLTDIDALGAALGICRAAATAGKPAHIVADDISEDVQPVIDGFLKDPAYEQDLFIDRERAMEITGADTALIVVDTNSTSYVACEELLHLTNTIVVLDHHRQGNDRVQNAVLSYIEPYASSACEVVAEVLQYFDDEPKLRGMEADAMYAGIVVDTNNFVTRTGVRTFEAAAYLRRSGADIVRVRKLFRDNMEDLRAKAQAVADAEIFDETYAISVCPSEGLHAPNVVAAQAANELLDVVGIKASFVLTDYNEQIYISARAIDEQNVQLIMERLGGGGHLNIAGAQLTDYTISEAKQLLKDTIDEMKEEGDI